jgi:hypothetical protein
VFAKIIDSRDPRGFFIIDPIIEMVSHPFSFQIICDEITADPVLARGQRLTKIIPTIPARNQAVQSDSEIALGGANIEGSSQRPRRVEDSETNSTLGFRQCESKSLLPFGRKSREQSREKRCEQKSPQA